MAVPGVQMTKPDAISPQTWVWLVLAALSGLLMVGMAVVGAILLGDITFFWPVLLAAWPVVGGLLVARIPGHLVGKLLVTFSVWFSVSTSAESYVYLSQSGVALPATDVVAWLAVWAITPVITIVLFLVAVFPTGRLESVWLRWPLRVSLFLTILGLIGRAVLPIEMAQSGMVFTNPWGVEALAPLLPLEEALYGVVILIAAAAVVDLVMRWRRSVGVERLQMRALSLTLAFFVVAVLFSSVLAMAGVPEDLLEMIETMAWVPGLAAQPVAIGVAVLRYRLYEIDRIVSRTVTYGVLVAVLAGVFFGVVTLLTSLVPTESDLAIAASTLAVAAVFNPLRRQVQMLVDRRFNRARYDAERVVGEFVGSLRDEVDLDAVVGGWVEVVDHTMQPSSATVWIRDGQRSGSMPE